MARTERSEAVLLRSTAFGEADRVVTLLTASAGKLALMARSARKSQRRFAGALEPYALIEAEFAVGRGEVGRLAEARVVRSFPGILSDLGKISAAAAGLELVRETIGDREPPDRRVIPTVLRYFERLAAPSVGEGADETLCLESVRLAFTLRWLSLSGLGPNLDACGRCGRDAPEDRAALFDPPLGALVCRACGGGPIKLSGAVRVRMRAAMDEAWDDRAAGPWPSADAAQVSEALDEFIERHHGRRLKAGDVARQVRARRTE